jgi:hypothetical protein
MYRQQQIPSFMDSASNNFSKKAVPPNVLLSLSWLPPLNITISQEAIRLKVFGV